MLEQIAVAAGVMENRFNAGVLLNLDAQALRAHAGRGARRVGHVDGVDAELRQQLRAPSISLVQSMPLGRHDFDQGDEAALGDQRADAGALGRAARAASRWSVPAPRR